MIYQSTGVRIARAASFSSEQPAILLPIISLIIMPTIYFIRTLSEHTYNQLTEDYILLAKAKGLRKNNIYLNHLFRNLLPIPAAPGPKMTMRRSLRGMPVTCSADITAERVTVRNEEKNVSYLNFKNANSILLIRNKD